MIGDIRRSTGRFSQRSVLLVGGANLVLGTLGFVPGVTTGIGALRLFGPASQALIMGVFQTSILLNTIHLALGIWAVIAAREERSAREYLIAGVVIYLTVPSIAGTSVAGLIALNPAARWLHLGFAVLIIALAIISTSHHHRSRRRRS